MRRRIVLALGLVVVGWLVVGCVAAPSVPVAPEATATPGLEYGRMAAEGTQAAAQATVQEYDRLAAQATADVAAWKWGIAQTQVALELAGQQATATEAARLGQVQATAGAVAQVATAAALSVSAEREVALASAQVEVTRAALGMLVCLTGLAMVGAILLVGYMYLDWSEHWRQRMSLERERLAVEVMRLRMWETSGGVMYLPRDGEPPRLLGPSLSVSSGSGAASLSVSSRRPDVIIINGREVPRHTPHQTALVGLLERAMALVGPESVKVPSAVALGMGGAEWQATVNLLKPDYLEARRGSPSAGGGTFLVGPHKTLAALLGAVRRGEVRINLGQAQAVTSPSPAVVEAG